MADTPADRAQRLATWTPILTDLAATVADTWRLVSEIHTRTTLMGDLMSKNSEALANLDSQIDDLVTYVTNDDVTDAAEVQARADRIKAALADARADTTDPAPVEPTGGEVV